MKVAATKIAEKMSKAAAAKIVTAAKARHEFVSQREELMKPVRAFGDRVRFLPSIPATDARPIRNIGWNNALVEMAQQSRAFVRLYALEHLRLVGHIKRLGLGRQLGDDNLEDMLDVVASGEEWPARGPPAPAPRRVAEAAGAQGQSATDATPTTRVQKPLGSASTAPVSSVAPPVRSTAPAAASAPPKIPSADPVLFIGEDHYARVVRESLMPQAARGRG